MLEMKDRSVAASLEGSQILRAGKADVFRIRERTRRKRVRRMIVILGAADADLGDRHVSDNPIRLPSLGPNWFLFLPVFLIFMAIFLMMAMPFLSGRSPHLVVRPEEIEVALPEVRGLDNQVDEVGRTLDVFLGYATFRDQLGGNPRRGVLFEGPPGTRQTYRAKPMAKQAGVPFLFSAAPAFQSMWFGMTNAKIRSFFRRLRKLARKEGGAIGFIEEIDAIGGERGGMNASPDPTGLGRVSSSFMGAGGSGMVNELLIQIQSFDQPPFGARFRARMIEWVNGFRKPERRIPAAKPMYSNILLIAATNRADNLDPALLRPGRFDRRLYFDLPSKSGRRELIDFFLDRKTHHQ